MKLFQIFKKKYRATKNLLAYDPLFNTLDKFKLSKIKKITDNKGFYYLKPKGWKFDIKIRRNFTDKEVLYYVLHDKYHLPAKSFNIQSNSVILDLGSNIGLTIAHMKHLYPKATIIGYEMNKENFYLAKRNTKFYKDVVVNNKAVWIKDTNVYYKNCCNYDAYSITSSEEVKSDAEQIEVESLTMNSIIKRHKLFYIDYLKMDIEGAEIAILESNDLNWMDIVHAMNIEMHLDDEKKIYDYIKIIESKGFKVWKDDKHWSSIFAVKNHT